MKDIKEKLPIAVKTGKVVIGSRKTLEKLLTGNPKLIITSGSCSIEMKERIVYYARLLGIAHVKIEGTTMEMGALCGKPFPASALAVMEAGDSKILQG